MSRQYSILVISDDTNLRHTLALILDHAGYAVTTAADFQEGVHDLEQMNFDLIFLDTVVPDLDGRLLLHRLRQLLPHIPIIMLTTHASPEPAIELWMKGASGFLTKPIDPQCILAQIHALLIEKQILRSEANSHAITQATDYQPGTKPPRPE
jgi:DNA-binding response OmpR family regulator